uniref:Uncharacterized protein n=1 Tax=Salix viminalis TaxID=40686 RepID=A0A6N2KQ02_SALVM
MRLQNMLPQKQRLSVYCTLYKCQLRMPFLIAPLKWMAPLKKQQMLMQPLMTNLLLKDVLDTSESKTGANEDQHLTAPIEASKPDETIEVQVCQGITKDEKSSEVINGQETSKSEDVSGVKADEEMGENVALRALTEAFEAVGYSPTPENRLSFSDVGNPVMALALFLARLAGPDAATASACSSLKSLSSNSPGMQLASRHCFLLEDPPDERKKQSCSDCVATEMADQDCFKGQAGGKKSERELPYLRYRQQRFVK